MARLTPREEAKLRQYEDLLKREPQALVFAPLASLYTRQFDFEKAVDVLKRGLETYPNYFSASVLLARCYIALDEFSAAVVELKKVLAADPYNVSALGLLSDELRNRGRLAEARDYYLKILEIEPDNEEYAYKLELLSTLIEGSPFAREAEAPEVAAEVVSAPTPEITPVPPPPPETERVEVPPAEEAAAEEPIVEVEKAAAAEPEFATLTLAKIYEDQGLFVRAREIIEKVLAREPYNAAAQEAYDHVNAVIASEESPTGASVIQLIKKIEAVSGLLEHDELELWEEVSAGVEEALAGFEEITLAQAVAATAGLTSFDDFIIRDDKSASWELDVAGVTPSPGAGGAEELDLELGFATALDLPAGVNVADLAAQAAPGISGTDEFDITSAGAATKGVDRLDVAAAVPAAEGTTGEDDFVLDVEAGIPFAKEEPAVEPADREGKDEFAVKPERYPRRKPLELAREPFEKEEDFLSWLDSIRLKEL